MRAILLHFWLAYDHPFVDGNGRSARAYLYTETDDNDVTDFLPYRMRVPFRAIDDLHSYLVSKSAELHDAEALVRRETAVHAELNPRLLALITHALKVPYARYTVESPA